MIRGLALCALMAGQVLAASPAAVAQTADSRPVLWNRVRAGMSVQAVLRAIAGAKMGDGGKTVEVPPTVVAGVSMNPEIEFSDGKAVKVSLMGRALPGELRTALAAKYGQPSSRRSCVSVMSMCVERWITPGKITVSLTEITGPRGSGAIISYEAIDTQNL